MHIHETAKERSFLCRNSWFKKKAWVCACVQGNQFEADFLGEFFRWNKYKYWINTFLFSNFLLLFLFLALWFFRSFKDSARNFSSSSPYIKISYFWIFRIPFYCETPFFLRLHYRSNQIKSNQIKSNQIKSNQIKSNQIK